MKKKPTINEIEQYWTRVRLPKDRVTFLGPDVDFHSLPGRGFVLILAPWSAWAMQTLVLLQDCLQEYIERSDFRLFIADSDEPRTQEFMEGAGDFPIRGAGEIYWLRNGRMQNKLVAGSWLLPNLTRFVRASLGDIHARMG